MISAALTSFLTGITEPIEFSFLFVAPLLYGIHALLAGVAYFVCIELGIKHGMTFSHGLIDFVVLFNRSTHGLWFLVARAGLGAAVLRPVPLVIRRFDLKTPGASPKRRPDAAIGGIGRGRRRRLVDLRASWCRRSADAPTSRASTPASRGCACSSSTRAE